MKNFRQALKYVWPYRMLIVIGALTAIGVSVMFTASVGMLIPILRVITSREGLDGWIYRSDVEYRLGVRLPQPDDPTLNIDTAVTPILLKVVANKPAAQAGFRQLDEIHRVNGQEIGDSIELVSLLARIPAGQRVAIAVLRNVPREGRRSQTLELNMPAGRFYGGALNTVVGWLPRDYPAESVRPASASQSDSARAGLSPIKASRVNRRNRLLSLTYILLGVLGLTILRNVCRYINELAIQGAGLRAAMDLRSEAYHRLTALPMGYFGKQGITDSISRLTQDVGQIQAGLVTLFGKAIQEPAIAVGAMAGAMWAEWRVALAALIAFPAGYLVIHRFGKKMRKTAKKALVSVARQYRVLEETLFGLKVVKAYTMEGYERKRFFRAQRQLLKEQLRMRRIDSAVSPLLEVFGSVGLMSAVVLAAYFVLGQTLEFGKLIAQLALLGLVADAGRKLSNVNNRLQQAEAAAERVFGLMNAPPEPAGRDLPKLGPLTGQIRFEGISFRYPDSAAEVLRGVDLSAPAGTITAVVGPNGSGKTTLLSLLPRFFDPQAGRVTWDGRDIRQANLRSLRARIGLVTQDAVIFADTVEANIRYGNKRIGRQAVIAAARQAFADEFIVQMPQGYDTVVGEHGTTLSGGQKQRIALARAILRDCSVLILDEAMSQVDPDSETKIQQALDSFLVGRTAFVIAHRFSTIRQADQIVVMDGGRIVGLGRHQDLMASCLLYRTLYETQFRRSDDQPTPPRPVGAPTA